MARAEPQARWTTRALPLLVVALGPAVLLAPLFAGQCLVPAVYQNAFLPWDQSPERAGVSWNALMADAVVQYYPWRHFARTSLRSGEIPLWNPYQLCGTPFLANGQSGVLYPPNVVFWLLPVEYAFGVGALLHLLFAGLCTYAFARAGLGVSRWGAALSGVAFELCGFLVAWTPMTAAMNTLCWMPAGLLTVAWASRMGFAPRVALHAIPPAMMILAGHLQFAYYGIALMLLFGTVSAFGERRDDWRRAAGSLGALAGGIALAAIVSAGQLLPLLELGGVNHRPAERSAAALRFLHDWSLDGLSAASIVTMAPYGNPSHGTWRILPQNYAELCGVVGVATGLLAAIGFAYRRGWREWTLAAVAILSLLIAFGTPVATLAYWAAPGFARFAGWPRILCAWSLSVALLAGVGLDTLARLREDEAARRRASYLLLGASALIATVVLGSVVRVSSNVRGAADAMKPDLVLFCLIAAASVTGVGATMRKAGEPVLVAVVVAELLLAGYGYTPTARPEAIYADHPAIAELQGRSEGVRALCLTDAWAFGGPSEAALPPNGATVFGVRDVQGYDSLIPRWAKHGASVAAGGEPCPEINGNMVLIGERTLERLDPEALSEQGVGAVLAGRRQTRALVSSGLYSPGGTYGATTVLIPNLAPKPIPEHDGPNRMVSEPRPDDEPGLVRETFERGWVARDETGAKRATRLRKPLGFIEGDARADETIRLSYEPASFAVGLFLSLVGCGLLSAVACRCALRRRGGGRSA